jgi:hypothetical protein
MWCNSKQQQSSFRAKCSAQGVIHGANSMYYSTPQTNRLSLPPSSFTHTHFSPPHAHARIRTLPLPLPLPRPHQSLSPPCPTHLPVAQPLCCPPPTSPHPPLPPSAPPPTQGSRGLSGGLRGYLQLHGGEVGGEERRGGVWAGKGVGEAQAGFQVGGYVDVRAV